METILTTCQAISIGIARGIGIIIAVGITDIVAIGDIAVITNHRAALELETPQNSAALFYCLLCSKDLLRTRVELLRSTDLSV